MRRNPDTRLSSAVIAAHAQLAKADKLRKAGNLPEAIKICESLIQKFPDYLGALHTLGLIHMSGRNYGAALSLLMRAAMLDPDDWTILTNLARLYLGLSAPELSARTLEQALAIKDDDADIHCTLGQIYDHQCEYERAAGCFEKALECDPNHKAAAYELGSSYVYMGRLEDAAPAFLQAHSIDRQFIAPIAALCQLPAGLVDLNLQSAIEAVQSSRGSDNEKLEFWVSFSKAAVFDKLKRHAEAWDHMVRANSIIFARHRQENQDRVQGRQIVLQRARNFTRKSDKQEPANAETPISLFILAPSRSGKTTLEMILGTLDGVKRGYENPIVERSTRKTSQHSGLVTLARPTELPEELNPLFLEYYDKELLARAGGFKVFTNTHPARISEIGRLIETIPNARFAFIKRNINDIALRIYMKHFLGNSNYYAYNIKSIFEEISWYQEIMDIWMKTFPERCVMLQYEDMVSDAGSALIPLAEQCGLALPSTGLPQPGDDRGCSVPYADFIASARQADDA